MSDDVRDCLRDMLTSLRLLRGVDLQAFIAGLLASQHDPFVQGVECSQRLSEALEAM